MADGEWVLRLDGGLASVERHWAALAAAGMLSAAERDGIATVHFADGGSATDELLAELPAQVAARWEWLTHQDWHARWRAQLTAVRAGTWLVTPSWLSKGDANELVIDPGQAFGTGHHETTCACLQALDVMDLDGRSVLDVGTGSGVLAIAAARRGATVTAVDTDPVAVEAALHNAARNDAAVTVHHGSVDVVAGQRFDVVVANLDSATLLTHAARLSQLLTDTGQLIASGVGNARGQQVALAFERAGLEVDREPGVEWTLLLARPSS